MIPVDQKASYAVGACDVGAEWRSAATAIAGAVRRTELCNVHQDEAAAVAAARQGIALLLLLYVRTRTKGQ